MKRRAWALLAVAGLSGCATYSLEELRHVTPQGTPFQNALSRYYKEFASSEEQQYDWIDSMHFADKGLRSAYGKEVDPEMPGGWDIPEDKLPELQKAYDMLMEALNGGARESQPEIAARAQYYYDCWVEQQEEAWQEDDIAYCRDGFRDTLDTLMGVEPVAAENPAPVKPKKKVVKAPKAEEKPVPPPAPMVEKPAVTPNQSFIVFFEDKQADMTASGRKTIEEVLTLIRESGPFTVTLNGYTDTVGDPIDNQKLSDTRAQAVRHLLVEGGVDESAIKIFAFGESDPPVKTADEVKEPANKRVTILLSK